MGVITGDLVIRRFFVRFHLALPFLSSHIGVHMTLIYTVPKQPSLEKRCAWPNPPPCSIHSV